jgi:Zn-finger nucleic acid-binding protein
VRCPRCTDVELAPGAIDGLASCPNCSGVSIDGGALLVACPALAGLERRALEIQLLGGKGQGIGACPRCGEAPFEFDVLGVLIDWCARCGAVWIDGDEREALSVKVVGPEAQMPEIRSVYRTDARAAQRVPRCALCQDTLVIEESYASEHGLICPTCCAREDIARADRVLSGPGGWLPELHAWLRKVALATSEAMRGRSKLLP